ncbi:MAG: hypothetical protein OEY19_10855, partial [Gammaproteobacteria bacterium]|nr:hypothetical protein [Gammaproteobacteria bacterium]
RSPKGRPDGIAYMDVGNKVGSYSITIFTLLFKILNKHKTLVVFYIALIPYLYIFIYQYSANI